MRGHESGTPGAARGDKPSECYAAGPKKISFRDMGQDAARPKANVGAALESFTIPGVAQGG
jgi:hypothetical protein